MTSFQRRGRHGASALVVAGLGCAVLAGIGQGCGDSSTTNGTTSSGTGGGGSGGKAPSTTSSSASNSGGGGAGSTTTSSGTSASTSSSGGAGGAPPISTCTQTASRALNGSAIALTEKDDYLAVVNRDVGSVTFMTVDQAVSPPVMTVVSEVKVGNEPWEVAFNACGDTAYVTLRADQKVVAITGANTGSPTVAGSVAVGSEPTGLVLSPNNQHLFVANWVDGTVTDIDPENLTVQKTIDLNATLVGTGLLGTVTSRPGLAHPRALAITNDGDDQDDNETLYVTEWYAQRTAPEAPAGANADTDHEGLLYKIALSGGAPKAIPLPPVADAGTPFHDHNDKATGCYPNQVGALAIDDGFVQVTSTCASPKGPLGVLAGGATCNSNTDCAALGGSCSGSPGTCAANFQDVRSVTHPAMTSVKIADDSATTLNLDALSFAISGSRLPLLPTSLSFFKGFGYLASEGSDAVYRYTFTDGVPTVVGVTNKPFIDLRTAVTDKLIRLPIGVVTNHSSKTVAFVANDGAREVAALDLNGQTLAGSAPGFDIVPSSALPTSGPDFEVLSGKRFFNTGLGIWSLKGISWGSCGACHVDGLSDNVTWYFNRGPRQTVSLDGTFDSKDPTNQRILNWTGVFDEIADFENNVRTVSGGNGAIVDATGAPLAVAADTPPEQGLQGSSDDIADPAGQSPNPHSANSDWKFIKEYIQTIRSPRAVTGLDSGDIATGKAIFQDADQGNCVGCHSGPKWTVSTRFYTPSDSFNAATAATGIGSISWNANLNGFPSALLPAKALTAADPTFMRVGAAPKFEQIECVLRPVGTFGVSPTEVNVLEIRQDMAAVGQGNATVAGDTGFGFNPPSLLGMQVGAPYFHAGNARTLEELLSTTFKAHYQSAVANVFNPSDADKKALVAYLLSIDESTIPVAVPTLGKTGGVLCHQ